MTKKSTDKIAIVGLGYVGLPLAVEFAKHYPVAGFDINPERVGQLKKGYDSTCETDESQLKRLLRARNPLKENKTATGLFITDKIQEISFANRYIITVPTPVDTHNRPQLTPLLNATESVGRVIKKGDIIIYESTVYPGATEEDCIPVLERTSGLVYNKDFFVGYSPERINPGDKKHTVTTIRKVTSGSTDNTAESIDRLYRSIITAGTHKAPSIKVAEAAKVIENAQRDINIAFMNELSRIFNRLNIETHDVLEAACTKWNFLPFYPGLVGGHCIGVDPYYLAHKAQEIGYHPEIILAGRRLNDNMGAWIASQVVKLLIRKGFQVQHARVLVLGITFKENCPDIRNSKVIDVIKELEEYGCNVEIADPKASAKEVKDIYEHSLITDLQQIASKHYEAIVAAVSHKEFMSLNPRLWLKPEGIIYDVKGIFDRSITDARL